jgi:hypothetical protein
MFAWPCRCDMFIEPRHYKRWLVTTIRPDLLTRRKEPPYPWNSRPGRLQRQSGSLRDEKPLWPLPRFELLNVHSVAQSLYRVYNANYMALGLCIEQWYCTLRLLRSRCRHVADASTVLSPAWWYVGAQRWRPSFCSCIGSYSEWIVLVTIT